MKKILKAGRNCMGIYPVERSGLLIDGRSYYRAFYEAALKARRYILIAGWQFDSTAALLRGDDVKEADDEVQFLSFLNRLCDRNPDLEIYLLAWDFSIIFSLDRELMQDWLFNWTGNERIRFLFDSRHAVGASHHQKFVVIDGNAGFIGGMDICSDRWDDREHSPDNPLRRNHAGDAYEQYHDIQSYHAGPLVHELKDIFVHRWKHACGTELALPTMDGTTDFDIPLSELLEAEEAALSRTQAKTLFPFHGNTREIRSLYIDAIDAAERLIYIENQYFSSQAVFKAMMDRLRTSEGSPIQIVIILPKQPHSLLENVSLGIAQAKMLQSLKENASQYGHSLGIYYTAPLSKEGHKSPTYIHAKLIIVDDRFLSIGSANTSNRSMGLDTELNVSWEAHSDERKKLFESIRSVRISLLAEHCGINPEDEGLRLRKIDGIVEFLNMLADDPAYRLQHHTLKSFIDDIEPLKNLKIEDLAIDPESPVVEENIYDLISRSKTGFFAEGISWLKEYLRANPGERHASEIERVKTINRDQLKKRNTLLTMIYGTGYFLKTRWYILLLILLICAFVLWIVLR